VVFCDVGNVSAIVAAIVEKAAAVTAGKIGLVIPVAVALIVGRIRLVIVSHSSSAIIAGMTGVVAMTTFDIVIAPLLFHALDVFFVGTAIRMMKVT
jgi:hypothetical protein